MQLIKFSFSLLEIGHLKLTVGKIYGGLMILENWRQTRFGKKPGSGLSVKSQLLLPLNIIITINSLSSLVNLKSVLFLNSDSKCHIN